MTALYKSVRKQLWFRLGNGALTDDAVQESMLAIYRGLPQFRGEADPRTWAITIATRTALRMRKREARYLYTADAGDHLATMFTDAAELMLLQRGLAQLAEKKRDAFVLMGILEMSATEAGRALGVFANTAASRFRHAREELEIYFSRGKLDAPRDTLASCTVAGQALSHEVSHG